MKARNYQETAIYSKKLSMGSVKKNSYNVHLSTETSEASELYYRYLRSLIKVLPRNLKSILIVK